MTGDELIPVSYHIDNGGIDPVKAPKKKIKIASSVKDGESYWAPLMPIVEFSLANGSELTSGTVEKPFYEDRNGSSTCNLVGSVTVQDVLDYFELPDHFEVGVPFPNSISDKKHRSEISFISVEMYKSHIKENEAREKEYAEKKANRLKRIEERKKQAALSKKGGEQ